MYEIDEKTKRIFMREEESKCLRSEFVDMFCEADESTPPNSYSLKAIGKKYPTIVELYSTL